MSETDGRRRFLRTLSVGTVGIVGVTAGVGVAGAVHAVGSADADHSDVDVGFCQDMTVHHVQALAMCQRVLGRDTGDSVQAAAVEVLQTQAIEVGMMRAWLTDWGESTAEPELAMGWMGMNDGVGMPTAMMPGLATDEEMRALGTAVGVDQGRLWLELMREHHRGGVDMAMAAVERATAAKVRRIAATQVEVQTYEIGQYDDLLATIYA